MNLVKVATTELIKGVTNLAKIEIENTVGGMVIVGAATVGLAYMKGYFEAKGKAKGEEAIAEEKEKKRFANCKPIEN